MCKTKTVQSGPKDARVVEGQPHRTSWILHTLLLSLLTSFADTTSAREPSPPRSGPSSELPQPLGLPGAATTLCLSVSDHSGLGRTSF
jgi:hypothetical protein